MLLLLYLLVCVSSFGLISLAPLFGLSTPVGIFNGNDILLLALLVLSVPAYLRQRRKLASPRWRRMELIWVVFIVFLAVQAFRSPASSLTERFVNVRSIQGYLLFFPSIAVLVSQQRLRKIAVAGLVFALVGTVLTIAQGLHGLDNLFDSPFYDIGSWGGNKDFVGELARVNLPISSWVAFVLLVLVAMILLRFRPWQILIGAFLAITILINFSRSLWLAMLAACAVMVILVLATGHVRRTSLLRLVVLVIILLAGLRIASFIGLSGLSSAISQRVAEGVYDVTRLAGNWAGRLEQQKAAMALWQSNPWLGIGTDYYSTFGNWIDLGLPLVLVSVGIVGLVIDFALFFGCFLTGILVLRQGIKKDSVPLLVVGAVLPAQVVLMLVYQQWLDPRGFAILGFVSALAVVSPGIFRDSGKAEVALSSGIVRFGQKTFRHV